MTTATKSAFSRRSYALAGRPALHTPALHPRRVGHGFVRQPVASCVVERSVVRPAGMLAPKLGLRIKSLAIGLIAIAGSVVGVAGYVSAVADVHAAPDASDAAAWAHVEP
ncbi:hypothetical protein [uncultured Tessaracoccus sp.]|uniref:hypothetical protein n=1 Tax=uncultured Tessaracoccus sp. TaxID=905023 RepID=UPI002631883E|nr:hypothetical protein [uncultured Tessaracoccus sp.]